MLWKGCAATQPKNKWATCCNNSGAQCNWDSNGVNYTTCHKQSTPQHSTELANRSNLHHAWKMASSNMQYKRVSYNMLQMSAAMVNRNWQHAMERGRLQHAILMDKLAYVIEKRTLGVIWHSIQRINHSMPYNMLFATHHQNGELQCAMQRLMSDMW
jgi:hypothetical protein